jgi:hypothetical protein
MSTISLAWIEPMKSGNRPAASQPSRQGHGRAQITPSRNRVRPEVGLFLLPRLRPPRVVEVRRAPWPISLVRWRHVSRSITRRVSR